MNFFENQAVAQRKTRRLVVLFALAVVAIVAVIYAIVTFLLSTTGPTSDASGQAMAMNWWRPEVLIGVSGFVLVIVSAGSLSKITALRGGGEAVAQSMGGRLVPANTRDLKERRLLNIVEEMAIASGIPVPSVYVMDAETGLNAFAAGYHPDTAVVAVTRGCLDQLKRDELQGVIAHEFSHILNGDMRLNIRLMGVLHGILVLSLIGYYAMRAGGQISRSRDGAKAGIPIGLIGFVVMIVGYVGVFFGKIIKSLVSQQREFLADASAVAFTRNPDGISTALRKIGGFHSGSRLQAPRTQECSHMLFANGIRSSFAQWMATHPPLRERILRINPRWDGEWLLPEPPPPSKPEPSKESSEKREPFDLAPGAPHIPGMGKAGAILAPILITTEQAIDQVGTVEQRHVDYARQMIESLPDQLRAQTEDGYGARAVIYAMLLDKDEAVRARQIAQLGHHADTNVFELTKVLHQHTAALPEMSRLPLIDLTLPALRTLSPRQYEAFNENLRALIAADEEMDFFEFALYRIVTRHLEQHLAKPARRPIQIYAVPGVLNEIAVLVSLLAYVGHDDATTTAKAFAKAMTALKLDREPPNLLPPEACGLAEAEQALTALLRASPKVHRQVLTACAECLGFDGIITPREAELYRAFGESLGCPVPPLMSSPDPAAG